MPSWEATLTVKVEATHLALPVSHLYRPLRRRTPNRLQNPSPLLRRILPLLHPHPRLGNQTQALQVPVVLLMHQVVVQVQELLAHQVVQVQDDVHDAHVMLIQVVQQQFRQAAIQ